MSLPKKRKEPPFQVKGVIIFFLVVIALCVYTFYFLVPSPPKKKPEFISTPKPKRPSESKINDYTATCRQINQQPGLEDVPVMFLSGAQLPDIIRRSHQAGGTYCLRKPFDPTVLVELIDRTLAAPAAR